MNPTLPKIVLIEDDENDAHLTQLALKKTAVKHELVWLDNGVEFIEYLDQHPTHTIALILLDIRMPIMTGLEVLEQIREKRGCNVPPVVIFSSSNDNRDIAQAYQLGISAYVTKPIGFAEFNHTIESIANFWLTVNQRPSTY